MFGCLKGVLLDCVFPRHCFACGVDLSFTSADRNFCSHLCDDCLCRIDFIFHGFCPRCGSPYEEEALDDGSCQRCVGKHFHFRRARSLFCYEGIGREMVLEFKYRSGFFLLPDFERLLRAMDLDLAEAVLVPVPMHWRRKLYRGFNQSELLAACLAKLYGSRRFNLLRRDRFTVQQAKVRGAEREKNMANVFSVREQFLSRAKIQLTDRIVLIDDVLTSGATASSCAQVLVERGFGTVDVLTLARA